MTPFRRILVANRGEIALRVMRTAHAMGFRTVAVFSSADRSAPHVRAAHQAVHLGGALPAESYLDVEKVIAAARKSGAEAIHPGYGFLAESATLARACREAGLVFVGPSPEAIAALGDKAGAKRLLRAAGVPCVPGYDGERQDDATLAAEADRIGYPVMVKAAAGGGGRGMRRVAKPGQLPGALRAARSEAQGAFGSAGLILERALAEPRHVEIQLLADRHGSVVHLGDRDCSVQRRHQKVIEEAPAPGLPPELRERMGRTAVEAARAVGYEGAGTVEFLLDGEGAFFFIEMNARLQVEHPVTEAITGLDLVELQLRIAGGEPLPLRQEEVRVRGHAIECRLCAESPEHGFAPRSGVLERWEMPGTVRVEHALEAGAEVPPFYDSMVAKLVGHGATREEARRKLASALQDAVAIGVETNQAFLARCLEHPSFVAGTATTAFVERHAAELLRPDPETGERGRALAAVLLHATAAGLEGPGSALIPRLPIGLRFEEGGQVVGAVLTCEGGNRYRVSVGDRSHEVRLLELDGSRARFSLDGLVERAALARDGLRLALGYRGTVIRVEDRTHAAARSRVEVGGDGRIRASMSGRVVAIHVAVGDAVEAGQAVLTLEAMKMEHAHVAAVAGKVSALNAALGEQVAAGRVVAEIEAAAAGA